MDRHLITLQALIAQLSLAVTLGLKIVNVFFVFILLTIEPNRAKVERKNNRFGSIQARGGILKDGFKWTGTQKMIEAKLNAKLPFDQ
ncbi:hypothetical protein [Pseudoalteromonas piscicida]|uniref:Uncharacterized protein n=1 Tax=Pseudoalteromonas piscicida TaxID=43662 RepID=A0A2A5JP37_PSEO7|nr:hypothetical protein [Pseudoalteromonas piscicida]PCK31170.1 hypothetical protein CEX98_14015 [Pseudoalteromonas piscicida]